MKVDNATMTPLDADGEPCGPPQELPGVTDVTFGVSTPFDRLRTTSLIHAGQLLGIGRTRCYELNRAGEFPVRVREIAGQLRVRLSDIEEFLDNT